MPIFDDTQADRKTSVLVFCINLAICLIYVFLACVASALYIRRSDAVIRGGFINAKLSSRLVGGETSSLSGRNAATQPYMEASAAVARMAVPASFHDRDHDYLQHAATYAGTSSRQQSNLGAKYRGVSSHLTQHNKAGTTTATNPPHQTTLGGNNALMAKTNRLSVLSGRAGVIEGSSQRRQQPYYKNEETIVIRGSEVAHRRAVTSTSSNVNTNGAKKGQRNTVAEVNPTLSNVPRQSLRQAYQQRPPSTSPPRGKMNEGGRGASPPLRASPSSAGIADTFSTSINNTSFGATLPNSVVRSQITPAFNGGSALANTVTTTSTDSNATTPRQSTSPRQTYSFGASLHATDFQRADTSDFERADSSVVSEGGKYNASYRRRGSWAQSNHPHPQHEPNPRFSATSRSAGGTSPQRASDPLTIGIRREEDMRQKEEEARSQLRAENVAMLPKAEEVPVTASERNFVEKYTNGLWAEERGGYDADETQSNSKGSGRSSVSGSGGGTQRYDHSRGPSDLSRRFDGAGGRRDGGDDEMNEPLVVHSTRSSRAGPQPQRGVGADGAPADSIPIFGLFCCSCCRNSDDDRDNRGEFGAGACCVCPLSAAEANEWCLGGRGAGFGYPHGVHHRFLIKPLDLAMDNVGRFFIFLTLFMVSRGASNLAFLVFREQSAFSERNGGHLDADSSSEERYLDRGDDEAFAFVKECFMIAPTYLCYMAPLVLLWTFANMLHKTDASKFHARVAVRLLAIIANLMFGVFVILFVADVIHVEHLESRFVSISLLYAIAYVIAFVYFPREFLSRGDCGAAVAEVVRRVRLCCISFALCSLLRFVILIDPVHDSFERFLGDEWFFLVYVPLDVIPTALIMYFLHKRTPKTAGPKSSGGGVAVAPSFGKLLGLKGGGMASDDVGCDREGSGYESDKSRKNSEYSSSSGRRSRLSYNPTASVNGSNNGTTSLTPQQQLQCAILFKRQCEEQTALKLQLQRQQRLNNNNSIAGGGGLFHTTSAPRAYKKGVDAHCDGFGNPVIAVGAGGGSTPASGAFQQQRFHYGRNGPPLRHSTLSEQMQSYDENRRRPAADSNHPQHFNNSSFNDNLSSSLDASKSNMTINNISSSHTTCGPSRLAGAAAKASLPPLYQTQRSTAADSTINCSRTEEGRAEENLNNNDNDDRDAANISADDEEAPACDNVNGDAYATRCQEGGNETCGSGGGDQPHGGGVPEITVDGAQHTEEGSDKAVETVEKADRSAFIDEHAIDAEYNLVSVSASGVVTSSTVASVYLSAFGFNLGDSNNNNPSAAGGTLLNANENGALYVGAAAGGGRRSADRRGRGASASNYSFLSRQSDRSTGGDGAPTATGANASFVNNAAFVDIGDSSSYLTAVSALLFEEGGGESSNYLPSSFGIFLQQRSNNNNNSNQPTTISRSNHSHSRLVRNSLAVAEEELLEHSVLSQLSDHEN